MPLASPAELSPTTRSNRRFALVWAAALGWGWGLSPSSRAATVDVAGVKMDDTIELRNATLRLNGAGVRYKAVFKVYLAALYLSKKASTAEEALQMPGTKRVSITMLRDIDANELGKLFTRSVEDNVSRSEFSKIIQAMVRMGQMFADQKKLLAGEIFLIDWIPGTGTLITVKGVAQGEPFKEPEFFNALLRIWLGNAPADHRLKDALLGKASDPVGQNH